jgi:hypothetical protein
VVLPDEAHFRLTSSPIFDEKKHLRVSTGTGALIGVHVVVVVVVIFI